MNERLHGGLRRECALLQHAARYSDPVSEHRGFSGTVDRHDPGRSLQQFAEKSA